MGGGGAGGGGGCRSEAREIAAAVDRVVEIEAGVFAATTAEPAVPASDPAAGPESGGRDVVALPAFDEYYLSYADRTTVCAPDLAARIGPTPNGQVAPILVSGGRVIGTWRHSVAAGRHRLALTPQTRRGHPYEPARTRVSGLPTA
ncbi:DNA glycosylase AlkZ-like family protein [Microbacterium arborescens]|uniref:DNA glycosylase AlkZ-like family protein n=1 Tax=Microbacterium arborescens TaxID=33883 RepID=UPI0027881367|nr:crosslink repair DNA glycosylase YcaQ family protein [Microbacterium arborescens]MDQ1215262.1 hypothetical protein [Microbacterium arborescens]